MTATVRLAPRGKYGNRRTWSELCRREFASAAEARRGEELALLERGGAISWLVYQPRFLLRGEDPRVTYVADFEYVERGQRIVEDVKGLLTQVARVKIAWLATVTEIRVRLLRAGPDGWEEIDWWHGTRPNRRSG